MSITQSYFRVTKDEFSFLRSNDFQDNILLKRSIWLEILEGRLFFYNNQQLVIDLINETEDDDELDNKIEYELDIFRNKLEMKNRYIDIQKEWDLLHFLLNGETTPEKPSNKLKPFSKFIIGSGETTIPATYNYVRYLLPEEIKEIVEELGKLSEEDLKELHKDKFKNAPELYGSSSPLLFNDEMWDYTFRIYDELVLFFQSAEDKNDVILISFD